jgi:hypothetical protein
MSVACGTSLLSNSKIGCLLMFWLFCLLRVLFQMNDVKNLSHQSVVTIIIIYSIKSVQSVSHVTKCDIDNEYKCFYEGIATVQLQKSKILVPRCLLYQITSVIRCIHVVTHSVNFVFKPFACVTERKLFKTPSIPCFSKKSD